MRIFHIATLADWEAAQVSGRYTTSTRDRSLAEEGFVHAARGDQWEGVRSRFYADAGEPLVLLVIETGLLDVPVVEETVPGSEETFPHVYGAITTDAVVRVLSLEPTPMPSVEERSSPPPVPRNGLEKSFRRLFLAELGFRAALGLGVLLSAALVGNLAQLAWGDTAGLLTALGGLLAAGWAGFVVSRTRDRRWREAHPSPR